MTGQDIAIEALQICYKKVDKFFLGQTLTRVVRVCTKQVSNDRSEMRGK